ncbi:putative signal peptide protein [Puccinia sorghi]|uniref:Putative signal peptide protein n=1 Tax=Puccinia sorghi TaxID=27349 RepID=A0A0L6UKJ5_9BASI|nr:putative signal peptide protein [Puccinia sorghi]
MAFNGKIIWHSHCAVCTVTVHQILVESILEKSWSNNISFLGLSECQMQEIEQVLFAVYQIWILC